MIPILFENSDILVVNKPSGIPSNSLSAEDHETVEAKVRKEQNNPQLLLLHRLDTGTSGALMFAKNESIYNEMREKFKLKLIVKKYLAFSEFSEEKMGFLNSLSLPFEINTPLGHHPKSKKRMIALPLGLTRLHRGKPLIATTFIEGFLRTTFQGRDAIEVKVRITTGVMHQIRVHLAHHDLPLLGDALYEKENLDVRLGLHANYLLFTLRGTEIEVTAPLSL